MADPSMALPAGKTCADCAHVARCVGLGYSTRAATSCDFAPSRFVEKATAPVRPTELRIYDRMLRGQYVSPLDPPPGDPRAAHVLKPGSRECAPECPCWATRRGGPRG